MNSKEALCYLDDIAHGRKMEYDPHELKCIVEKDLKILEIIKRKLIIATNFVSFITYDNDEEYKKIMEWIINEINKNKSGNS